MTALEQRAPLCEDEGAAVASSTLDAVCGADLQP